MAVPTDLVKELRARTGAGVMDCRRALEETGGDLARAAEVLRARGLAAAARRAGRETSEGLVEAYIHAGGRLGALVELNCETDFVARTEEFRTLARELAMQVAAATPTWVSADEIPAEVLAARRAEFAGAGDGDALQVEARLAEWIAQTALLEQPYIRDPGRRVRDLIADVTARVGEHVRVRRFARFKVGE